MLPAYTLQSNHVVDIGYVCGDLIHNPTIRRVRGHWTGAVSVSGMFEILPVASQRPLYLFPDEIVEVEAL